MPMRFRQFLTYHLAVLGTLAAFLIPPFAMAGPVSSQGTEFWLTFPTQYLINPQTLTLSILSQTSATGQVSIPGLSYNQSFSLVANNAVTLVVPTGAMLTTMDGVQNLSIHVTSDNNISVFGLEYEQFATDGYLALPVGAIGTNYWVCNYTADVAQGPTTTIGSSEFAVVAAEDSTSVTITPPITVGPHPAGAPYTVALNRGQAYQLQANLFTNDLTGTQVASNFPVALFSANGCADVPVSFGTCNMLLEQELPLSTWGTSFITIPLAGRNKDTFRYLASANGTIVSVNGSAAATLNQGQFFEQMLSTASSVTATAPILVMQYSNSHQFDGVTMGDPCQITVPPISDFGTSYQTSAPSTGFTFNFLNVAAPNLTVGAVLLDGTAIPAGNFTLVGASGFSSAQVTIGTGFHQLSGPQPFGVESYGFDTRDAYGYPAGLVFTSLPTLTPSPTPTITPTPPPAPTLTPVCEIKIWPVPFNPKNAVGGLLKMDCLQPGDKISFYTLAGERVQQATAAAGHYEWDGTNQQGSPLAPGIYFYAVERNGTVVKRDKFILMRS
jgi:hypothetical protein